MTDPLLTDEKWKQIQPLIPPQPPRPNGGRPRPNARRALTAILFVLRTGIPWRKLPLELGYGSGWSAWRLMRDWQAQGVLPRLLPHLVDELGEAGLLRAQQLRTPVRRPQPSAPPLLPYPPW